MQDDKGFTAQIFTAALLPVKSMKFTYRKIPGIYGITGYLSIHKT